MFGKQAKIRIQIKEAPAAVFRGLCCTNLTLPTGNLDSKTSDEVIGLLKMSAQKYGQTLVMITHDQDIAQIADRILVIEDGRVVEQ